MHFNIYIDDQIGSQLNKLAKRSKKTRNALIREALKDWVEQKLHPKWSEAILEFKGVKNYPAFEKQRKKLKSPTKDPFA